MRTLSDTEVRILGALMEKEIATPEYYPLTINALTNACNQKSSRDPIVNYDESTVSAVIDQLNYDKFVCRVTGSEMRVPKYRQNLSAMLNLTPQQYAVLCVLMLRGPQTVGEIKGRTGRLFDFKELAEVEETLRTLMDREEKLAVKLPRLSGRDSRYMHLLGGEVLHESVNSEAPSLPVDKIDILIHEVGLLQKAMDELHEKVEMIINKLMKG